MYCIGYNGRYIFFMNAIACRRVGLFLTTLMLVIILGCSTTPKPDWSARIGSYTYDQAIVELGPPDRSAKLTDGTTVAEWLTQRGTSYGYVGTSSAYGYGQPYFSYGPILEPYASTTLPNQYMRLTFSTNGTLAEWKKIYR